MHDYYFSQQRTMVWNLTGQAYDPALFEGNVVTHGGGAGHASPALGLLVKITLAIENWIASDDGNAAAVHCTTGRGRTVLVCACVLAWMGVCANVEDALERIVRKMRLPAAKLLIPSQRRYLRYFGNILDGAFLMKSYD
jgi:tensin|tara:strand:+ start:26 stop:442 length:417 start_codon:yes stop_codon:yes gene_type:complete